MAAAVATGCIPSHSTAENGRLLHKSIVFLRILHSISATLFEYKSLQVKVPFTFKVVDVRIVAIKALRHL